jgi:transcriptional regulator with XRE-family HTH domain
VEGRKLKGLRGLRQDRALSQRDLAEASGVTLSTINRLELGRQSAYPVTVRKLAAALGVSPRELYGPENEGPDG